MRKTHDNLSIAAARTLHATCVAWNGAAALFFGHSGSGKSDLALRMVERGLAQLVADDYVELRAENGTLYAASPARLRGLLEVRGVGIVPYPYLAQAPVRLAITLESNGSLSPAEERLPMPHSSVIAGVEVAACTLDPWALSAPERVCAALRLALAESAATPQRAAV